MTVKGTLTISPQILDLAPGSTLTLSEECVCIARVSESVDLQATLKVTLRIPPRVTGPFRRGKRMKPVIASVRVWLLSWYIIYPEGWVGSAQCGLSKRQKPKILWL